MAFTHTPEFRKILWGGLVAWLIQGGVVLAWTLGRTHGPLTASAHSSALHAPTVAVAEPAAEPARLR